jgi:hypothetical protein
LPVCTTSHRLNFGCCIEQQIEAFSPQPSMNLIFVSLDLPSDWKSSNVCD